MKKKNHIYKTWESQAKKHKGSPEASWGDSDMVSLEVKAISEEIEKCDFVLDVGCANGHATVKQLRASKARFLVGVDYCSDMIKQARKHNTVYGTRYHVSDIRNLDVEDGTFDVVYTTRTLINLPTWEEQIQGIKECIRVCKPGGKVVFCEAFWEPLAKLNAVRTLFGLSPLVEHDFNRYLKTRKMHELCQEMLNKEIITDWQNEDFSSLYYFGSRILRDLYTDGKVHKGYDYPINHMFREMQEKCSPTFSTEGVGVQQKFVLTKR